MGGRYTRPLCSLLPPPIAVCLALMNRTAAPPLSVLRIATRGSPLALWQANYVAKQLQRHSPDAVVRIIPMRTTGDKLLQAPLAMVGGKGLFLKELETALLNETADIAVHSMKDVPSQLPSGLHIPVVLKRADPRDALVSTAYPSLAALPRAARVGTSSLRRQSQARHLRTDLRLINLRGGIDTRLRRLRDGDFDAILLAVAGLERIAYDACISEILSPERMLPAIGQGIIGIECRYADSAVESLIAPLRDAAADHCIRAERSLGALLMGSCQTPLAAFAEREGTILRLRAQVASLDGQRRLYAEHTATIATPPCATPWVSTAATAEALTPEALGRRVAEQLQAQGAQQLIADIISHAG